MHTIGTKIIITGILILIIIVSGIWLSRLGKPYNVALFTIHKIISILAIISTVITIYHLQKPIEISNIEWVLMILTGLLFLMAFVTGALMSFEKPVHAIISITHKITPFLIVISTALIIYLLATGR